MSIASWIVDGLVPSFHNFNAGIESNAAVYGSFSDYVTIHSPAAANLLDYGMEDVLIVSSPDCCMTSVESGVVPADQQFCDTLLPSTPEDTVWSDWQFRQVVPLLQTTQVVAAVEPQGFESPECVVPSSLCLSLSSSVPLKVVPETNGSEAVFFDTKNEGREDDLMDVLSQLCDTVEGDMIIEQAKFTAFDSILPKMSPEDIDSLLSSDTLDSESHGAVWSSSSSSVSSPPSPFSDYASTSSEMLTVPPVEKKQRKKEQNKTAALRYRQKKRSEHGTVMTECEDLEKRNVELKTKVSEMMKEIDYLKGLIAEIYA